MIERFKGAYTPEKIEAVYLVSFSPNRRNHALSPKAFISRAFQRTQYTQSF
jgi:hypothetical protein